VIGDWPTFMPASSESIPWQNQFYQKERSMYNVRFVIEAVVRSCFCNNKVKEIYHFFNDENICFGPAKKSYPAFLYRFLPSTRPTIIEHKKKYPLDRFFTKW
jgi:hypothetical protein